MKRISLILSTVFIIVGMFTMSYAAERMQELGGKHEPNYTNTASIDSTISISNMKAFCKVDVQGKKGATKITINMTLQKKSGKSWKNIKTWEGTKKAKSYCLTQNQEVGKGSYRVKGTVKVYKGKNCETITKYSGIVKS